MLVATRMHACGGLTSDVLYVSNFYSSLVDHRCLNDAYRSEVGKLPAYRLMVGLFCTAEHINSFFAHTVSELGGNTCWETYPMQLFNI